MPSEPSRYPSGRWIVLGTVLGAFVGLLVDKFAIGMIVGFFAGIVIDARKRKQAAAAARDGAASDDRPAP